MSESEPGADTARERAAAWSAYSRSKAALRRGLVAAGVLTQAQRLSRRAVVVIWLMLVAVLVFLHVKAQNDEALRNAEVLAQLATLKLIDARWDVAVLQSRGPNPPPAGVVQARDVATIQRALDNAVRLARSTALRSGATELKQAYAEKADLVTRYQQASGESRHALEAAMRADAAVSGLVRQVWRDFPQRDRLVAAENLVARVLAEAQQYHHSPSPAHRNGLAAAASDLPQAKSLPPPVLAGLERLESDVHQILLLKPLEQMLGERLKVLNTAARADEIAETFRRSLADAVQERSRYRVALLVYAALLAVLAAYSGMRLYRRYRALEAQCEQQNAELADAKSRLGGLEEDAVIVEEGPAASVDAVNTEPPGATRLRRAGARPPQKVA